MEGSDEPGKDTIVNKADSHGHAKVMNGILNLRCGLERPWKLQEIVWVMKK